MLTIASASFHLKHSIVYGNRVALVYGALVLQAEDPIEIFALQSHKRAALLRRRTVNLRLNSAMYSQRKNSLAGSRSLILRSRSSCGKRPCHVP